MFSVPIGAFLHKPQGTQEKVALHAPMTFEETDAIRLGENIKAEVRLLKLPHEINVQIRNLETAADCVCSRCLASFLCPIKIAFVEREFLIDVADREIPLQEDIFYVDKDTHALVLDEMLRQEILLHFPIVPVCSESCKGLCNSCGMNLNEGQCEHVKKDPS